MLSAALSIGDADVDAGIDLALTVRNIGDAPETLRFRTGQRADFAAYRLDGEAEKVEKIEEVEADGEDPVWRYGTGRMFTQVLGSETLEPGKSTTYEATWGDPPSGWYRFVGEVTAEDCELTATATAEID
ncbi:BsuPI-related putative proteinase inhibitor [Halorubrum sp. N11]|uniref:BsuPI-related putative proteinase inhibitor n=1 Tax=Halorubrum sp. N11 TaxID=3402276 RepID=UPI003EBD1C20